MRAWAMAVLLAGCTQPPMVNSVTPTEGLPGTEVDVMGERFGAEATVQLEPVGGSVPVSMVLSERSAVVLSGTVPEDLAPGAYTLVVVDGGTRIEVDPPFTVKAPVVDVPCGNLYTANTTTSLITKEVFIDRFYTKDGRRETLRIPLADLEGVEYERLAREDGSLCHVVWLRKGDGERVRYADDAKNDLKARAYKFAQELGKPISVTREDDVPPVDEPAE